MKVLVMVVAAFSIIGCASLETVDPALRGKPFVYVFEFPGKTAIDLYKLSDLWAAETYRDVSEVVTYRNEEITIMRGRAIGEAKPTGDFYIRGFYYGFTIETKDGKARISFSDITPHRNGDIAGLSPEALKYKGVYEPVKNYFDFLSETFNVSLLSGGVSKDW